MSSTLKKIDVHGTLVLAPTLTFFLMAATKDATIASRLFEGSPVSSLDDTQLCKNRFIKALCEPKVLQLCQDVRRYLPHYPCRTGDKIPLIPNLNYKESFDKLMRGLKIFIAAVYNLDQNKNGWIEWNDLNQQDPNVTERLKAIGVQIALEIRAAEMRGPINPYFSSMAEEQIFFETLTALTSTASTPLTLNIDRPAQEIVISTLEKFLEHSDLKITNQLGKNAYSGPMLRVFADRAQEKSKSCLKAITGPLVRSINFFIQAF